MSLGGGKERERGRASEASGIVEVCFESERERIEGVGKGCLGGSQR